MIDNTDEEQIARLNARVAELLHEIKRLQDAKRRALQIADERVKEANELRSQLVTKTKILNRYRNALVSIAANTCCDRCQEAALVAQSSLSIG